MKKYIISTLTVLTFAVYVLYQRVSGSPVVLPNNQLATNTTSDVTSQSSSSGDGGNNIFSNILNSVTTSSPTPAPITTKKTTTVKTTPVVVKPTPVPVAQQQGKYKNGTYTGSVGDAYYGNVQVQAVIQNGALANVVILDYPQDRSRSVSINTRVMPILVSEAIQAQSANVNTVSGATDSSGAFRQSLDAALSQALI